MTLQEKKYKLAVVIGRFQPFHEAHLSLIKDAFSQAEHLHIALGSAKETRTTKNPFSDHERRHFISKTIHAFLKEENPEGEDFSSLFSLSSIEDCIYNDQTWIRNVEAAVANAYHQCGGRNYAESPSIALIGHDKDDSSYYLKTCFPNWTFIPCKSYADLSATQIRKDLFTQMPLTRVPPPVETFLNHFRQTTEFSLLEEEYHRLNTQKILHQQEPFSFVSVFTLFIHKAHLLVRKEQTGLHRGLYALPETRILPSHPALDGVTQTLEGLLYGQDPPSYHFLGEHSFAGSSRFPGQEAINAFVLSCPDEQSFPKLKQEDEALWIPLEKLHRATFIEGHFDLLSELLPLSPRPSSITLSYIPLTPAH